jgi:hypothetical protein
MTTDASDACRIYPQIAQITQITGIAQTWCQLPSLGNDQPDTEGGRAALRAAEWA